ncbi:MAG: hypothetical protein AAGA73_00415 [Pseudomonadota bacterium]
MAVDDPALLLGPRYRPSAEQPCPAAVNRHYFEAGFRSPMGHLGYRRASVAEANGEPVGFMICTPLIHLKDELVGSLLPENVVTSRYGENLSNILNLYLLCISKSHRDYRFSLKLLSYCLSKALDEGYDYVMTQMWVRNQPSYRGALYCGFKPLYQMRCRYSDHSVDEYAFVDYDLSQKRGVA